MVCLGDLVADVAVHLGGPIRAATDTPARIEHRRGGSAAGVAAAVVAAGGRARFVGRVGAGGVGDDLLEGLTAAGVDLAIERGGRIATVVVLVDASGERTMLTDRAAAADLVALPEGWDEGVGALHVPAYSFSEGATAHAARRAWQAAQGALRSVSTAGTGLIADIGADRFRRELEDLSPDVVIANGDEAAAVGLGQRPLAHGATVVTRGAEPTVVLDDGGRRRELPVPVTRRAVDTTGAGDAFTGGLLAALVRGRPLDAAVAAGHDAAGRLLASRRAVP